MALIAAMAVLILQHWEDVEQGPRELRRVVRRRVVLVTMDVEVHGQLWLIRVYLPETVAGHAAAFPSISRLLELLPGAIPVPRDCTDGFMAAFWARPDAYLDPAIRAARSLWLRRRRELDVGLRLICADVGQIADAVDRRQPDHGTRHAPKNGCSSPGPGGSSRSH